MPTLVNNFTKPVILDDDRDPYVSWQHHRERGSQGGVDLAYPEGTEVLSIADGTCEPVANYGTGGNTMRVRLDDGSYVEFMHLSSFARGNGERVAVGEVIGYSGSTGGDYAPHLHVHVYVNGTRCNVWDYFGADTSSGAQPSSSATMSGVLWSGDDWSYAEPIGDLMARVQSGLSARGLYNYDDGSARPADGLAGEFTRKGVQRLICDTGFFCGDIDGKIWRGGSYGVQDFATAYGNYAGRGGVRDGAPRLLSWTCFADGLDAYVASKQPAAAPVAVEPVPEPAPAPAAEPEQTTSVSETATTVEASGTADAPVATEEQPAGGGASDATPSTVQTPEPIKVYQPVTKEGIMTIQESIPAVEVDSNALGSIVTDTETRKRIYASWSLFGMALSGLGRAGFSGGLTAVGAMALGWHPALVVTVGVFSGLSGFYSALSQQVSNLAAANTKAKK